jgi:hypothetical protein
MRTPSKRLRWALLLAAVPVGLLASGMFVWQASYSAFSATATNSGNSWSAGTVTISASPSTATAAFNVSGIKPGDNGKQCVKVSYTGSLNSTVKLYLKNSDLTGTGLGTYLTFQVREGSGNNSDCSDFSSSANDYNNVDNGTTPLTGTAFTLAGFNTTAHDYASGVSSWAATTGGTKTYEFLWTLQDNNSAQGLNSSATFTWEADNT